MPTDPMNVEARLRQLHPALTDAEIATLVEVAAIDPVGRLSIRIPNRAWSVAPSAWAVSKVLDHEKQREQESK